MRLPYAYSHDEKKPSVTLLFVWVSGMLAVISTFALNFTEKTFTAACVAICFWAIAMVLYRIRRLDKFKIDLDDRSIELDAYNEKEDKDA